MTRPFRIMPEASGSAPAHSAAASSLGSGAMGRLTSQEGPELLELTPDAGASADAAGTETETRDVGRSARRGWRRTCPACGGGPLYDGYLTVRETCPACAERLDLHSADDLPTWMTIIVVGHIVAPLMLTVWEVWDPPIWVHWTLWPPMALLLSLWLLPRFKGLVVGLQWAKRMARFGRPGKG